MAEAFDSHLFLSSGGWMFEDLATAAGGGGGKATVKSVGHVWLIEPDDRRLSELAVIATDGP